LIDVEVQEFFPGKQLAESNDLVRCDHAEGRVAPWDDEAELVRELDNFRESSNQLIDFLLRDLGEVLVQDVGERGQKV
jgi:hypothetical protein